VFRVGAEGVEHGPPLLFAQPAEIELVVVAQERAPWAAGRPLSSVLHRSDEGTRVGRRERIEQVLIDMEVEHHVDAVAVIAEILHGDLRHDVRLGENDGIADAPLQEFPECAEHVVLLAGSLDIGALGADYERHHIHAESRHAQLNPEAHDLQQLGVNVGMGRIEVRLEVIEPVEVPRLGHLVVSPGGLLDARKRHAFLGMRWTPLRPYIPVVISGLRIAPGLLEPGMFLRRVVDHRIDEDADAALPGPMCEFDKVAK
jgi:hypothetical protein